MSRYRHACGSYSSPGSGVVLLVTGGQGEEGVLASTHTLSYGAERWMVSGRYRDKVRGVSLQTAGDLPSPRYGLQAASLNGVILVTGGSNGGDDYSEVTTL